MVLTIPKFVENLGENKKQNETGNNTELKFSVSHQEQTLTEIFSLETILVGLLRSSHVDFKALLPVLLIFYFFFCFFR